MVDADAQLRQVMFTITADTLEPKASPLGGRSHDLLWARLWELREVKLGTWRAKRREAVPWPAR
jgi:hypothetical protein